MTLPDALPSRTAVEFRARAELDQVPVLRAVAETVAILADFDLDHVSDIKLAVDEVCSALVADSAAGADVVCRFEPTDGALHVQITTDTRSGSVPNRTGFGWHVLRTVTDSVDASRTPRAGGGFRTTVDFSKLRTES